MTQPTNPTKVKVEGSDAHESQQNGDPQLATGAQARLEEEQQIAWLREGPEVFHAPGTHFPSRKTIGLSTLALVVSGLAVAAMGYNLAPGPVSSEPQARLPTSSVLTTHAPSTVPPAPVATNVTSATAPDAPVSPASPMLVPAAPTPEEHVPRAGGTTERRSNSRHEPLAPPRSPAPMLSRPSSEDGDQEDKAQPAPLPPPSQDQPHQQSQWRWKKTTTCDSSGRCVDHYNPAPSDQ
jgi:type IV secretory pathway VirB10-like protein